MPDINTADDLYSAISQLVAQYEQTARPLEEYLRALWGVALCHREQDSLTPDEFFAVLAEAFTAEPYPLEPELWLENHGDIYALGLETAPGYEGWEFRVMRQIIDLIEMDLSGQLANELRYFGIDAPRGERWYNFDPCTFLECATRGTFLDGAEDESAPLGEISWERFRDFLGAGQAYE